MFAGKRLGTVVVALLALGGASVSVPAQDSPPDIVIINGRVIDPETKLDAVRNVRIKNGKIAAVSAAVLKGQVVVDAAGLVVAPGFIDWHAHGQSTLADRVQAFDGVTTALELEGGMLPIGRWYDLQTRREGEMGSGMKMGIIQSDRQILPEFMPDPEVTSVARSADASAG